VEHTTKPWRGRESLGRIVRFILRIRGASWVRVSEKIPSHPSFEKQALIRNIIDPKIFQENSKLHGNGDASGRLIFIGRLSQEKRPDLFVQLARRTGINSLVIGDGVLRIALQVENKDLNNLKFLGQCNNPWENISDKDLVIVTSEFEGDGLVALEAAAIGIPVVLRNTPDLRAIGFPAKNYFEDILELVGKLSESDFSSFLLAQTQSQKILAERKPEVVSLAWFRFILTQS
jgi:glycosyltransferase involved in cell wall biosynthesis